MQKMGVYGDTHISLMTMLIDEHERLQMTPEEIDAKNPSEVFEAEHVIILALEVLRGEKL